MTPLPSPDMTGLFLAIVLLTGVELTPTAPLPVPLPVLRSGVEALTIRDGSELQVGAWRIAPELDPDIYEAKLINGQAHTVVFSSDIDSIQFEVEEGKSYEFVVRYGDRNCRTRIVGTRFVAPAVFDEAYRAAHRGSTRVEVPEVYELVNVALALTPTGQNDPDLVYQRSDYYRRMRAWFDRFRDQPVLAALDAELTRDPGSYFNLKMNGYSFEFDSVGRIVQSRIYDRTGFGDERSNSLRAFVPGLQALADASGFRRFYAENRSLYAEQVAFFETQADLPGMLSWLKRNFPTGDTYDGYKVIFSPLVAYNQSATWLRTPNYRELQAHVNFPYEDDLGRNRAAALSPAARLLFRGNIVFTELNHGFINPETDRHAARATAAVAGRSFWVDDAKGPSYYGGIATFNEYLNWGLVSLRYVDLAPPDERTAMSAMVADMMVNRRGFRRFREFDAFLTALYRGRQPNETLADLYPRILDWFEREQAAGARDSGRESGSTPISTATP